MLWCPPRHTARHRNSFSALVSRAHFPRRQAHVEWGSLCFDGQATAPSQEHLPNPCPCQLILPTQEFTTSLVPDSPLTDTRPNTWDLILGKPTLDKVAMLQAQLMVLSGCLAVPSYSPYLNLPHFPRTPSSMSACSGVTV